MIFKIKYETRTPAVEIVIPWADVWNGKYREMLKPVFDYISANNMDLPKISEYRDGLVWELKNNVTLPDMPVLLSRIPKTKIKISGVFKYENFFTDGIVAAEYNGTAESG